MRSGAGRAFMSPEEIDAFYENLKQSPGQPRIKDEFLGKDKTERLGPFGEMFKIEPRSVL